MSDLFDLEEAGAGADVVLPQLVGPVHHRGAARPADAVIVRLPHTPDGRDARLEVCRVKEGLSETAPLTTRYEGNHAAMIIWQ